MPAIPRCHCYTTEIVTRVDHRRLIADGHYATLFSRYSAADEITAMMLRRAFRQPLMMLTLPQLRRQSCQPPLFAAG